MSILASGIEIFTKEMIEEINTDEMTTEKLIEVAMTTEETTEISMTMEEIMIEEKKIEIQIMKSSPVMGLPSSTALMAVSSVNSCPILVTWRSKYSLTCGARTEVRKRTNSRG